MTTIQASDFLANTAKYLDFSMTSPLAIVNELGEILKISKPKKAKSSDGWIPTAQDLEDIRIGREQWERGEHARIRHGESLDDFLKRIGKI